MKKLLKVFTSTALTMTMVAGTGVGLGSTLVSAAETGAESSRAAVTDPNAVTVDGASMRNAYIEVDVKSNGKYVLGTTGGNPDIDTDDDAMLLYGFPDNIWSAYDTIVVDGENYEYGADGFSVDPEYSAAEKKHTETADYGKIKATQQLSFVKNVSTGREDVLEIKYILTNTDTVAHTTGLRIMFDTKLGSNDHAPFRVAGYGDVTTETEFEGDNIPQYWQAFDSLTSPKVISQGSFLRDGDSSNNPDKVQFCNWSSIRSKSWDYKISEDSDNGDSAVGITWYEKELGAGETRTYSTYYGLSELTQDVAPPLSLSVYGDSIVTSKAVDQTTGNPIYNNVTVTAYVENVGSTDAHNSYARLVLPKGMSVVGGTAVKTIGTIEKNKIQQITWTVKVAGTISAGEYNFKVLTGCDETTEKSVERKITVPAVLKNNSKLTSTELTIGEKINIKAAAEGGYGTYLYAMYYKKAANSGWTKIQDYSTNVSASVKPQKAVPYQVMIKVKDGNGSVADKIINVNVYEKLVNKSTISANEINLGSTVTFNGAAEGGSGEYRYAYYYKQGDSDKWVTKQDYTPNATASLKPQFAKGYDMRVTVKDVKTGKTASLDFTLNVKDPLKNTSTASARAIVKGNSVTVTASAKGGKGGYTYAVFYKKTTDKKWTTAQSFKANTKVVITPKAATKYDICVKVKDSEGTIDKKYLKVIVNRPLANTSTISAENIVLGGSVDVKASATDGMGEYTYAVFYKKSSDKKWTTAQSFKTNTKVTITPKAATTYQVCVKVKDGEGNVAKKYFDVKVNKKLVNTSTVSASKIVLGKNLNVKASATGGMGEYTYAVFYKKTTDKKWTTKQSFKTNASVAITPKVATKYQVCVKVKDSTGTIAKKYFDVEVTKGLVNTSTITVGDKVTLKGSATGYTGACTYAFCYKKTADKKWINKQSFNANNALTIAPSKGVSYDYCIKVKDAEGNVTKKYFSVTIGK